MIEFLLAFIWGLAAITLGARTIDNGEDWDE